MFLPIFDVQSLILVIMRPCYDRLDDSKRTSVPLLRLMKRQQPGGKVPLLRNIRPNGEVHMKSYEAKFPFQGELPIVRNGVFRCMYKIRIQIALWKRSFAKYSTRTVVHVKL